MQLSGSNINVLFFCMPDVDAPIGGVKQLFRQVEHLQDLKVNAKIVTESPDFKPSWFASKAPTISFQTVFADSSYNPKNTILVLPETYSPIVFKNYRGLDISGYRYVIFNQNTYYTFNGLATDNAFVQSRDFYRSENLLHVNCVSDDNLSFLSSVIGVDDSSLSRIVNGLEDIFKPSETKYNYFHWMPRKNPNEVNNVMLGLQHSSSSLTNGWQGIPLDRLPHATIAEYLSRARIFLSFGHPEGFGLPIAEAMASGCWVIGYSGMGGKELFNFGASTQVEFGDWNSFVNSTNTIMGKFLTNPEEMSGKLSTQSKLIKAIYSKHEEKLSIYKAWGKILHKFSVIAG